MKKFTVIIFCLIGVMLNTVLFAAQKQVDIKGWNKAQWGMTKEQLSKAFEGQAVMGEKSFTGNKKMYGIVKIPDYEIDDILFTVSLLMDIKDDKLRKIGLSHSDPIESQFTSLKILFTQKYGIPKIDERTNEGRGDYKLTATWFLPSTKIELEYYTLRVINKAILHIFYTDINFDKNALEQI
jgi:hypothetical protein